MAILKSLSSVRKRAGLVAAGVILGLAAIALWGFVIEPSTLVIHRERIEIAGWKGEHKIAVLSDLHIGSPHVGLDKLRKIVAETNAEHPEVIVMLGDYVIGGPNHRGGVRGGSFIQPEPVAQELKNLRSPLGTFAVLGNHDWWYDGIRITKALADAGITVLENQAVPVDGFWIAGIADLWTRDPDPVRALADVTDSRPVIFITHNPDIFPEVPARVGLTIAGHTHGGQVNFPIFGNPFPPSPLGYRKGHFFERGRHLFVGTGIGTSIVPARFRVPPEIVILTVAEPR